MSAATESSAMDTDQLTGQKRSLEEATDAKAEEPPAKRARVDSEAKADAGQEAATTTAATDAAEATEEKKESDIPKVTHVLAQELAADLEAIIKENNCAPIFVRLAWHDAGTFCKETNTGGPRACMRHEGGEAAHGANNGLEIARNLLTPVMEKFAGKVSVADMWAFAGVLAVKTCGGPDITFRFGRSDATSAEEATPDGRLPDATQGADHLREVFGRMGMNIREIVALSGAHTLGHCHKDRSGFEGAWTADPLNFDNSFFVDLLNKKWTKDNNEAGLPRYKSEDGTIMLMSDYALVEDDAFKNVVSVFAGDQDKFREDFASAFQKLIELGCGDSLYVAAE